jgi:hypothetical protein
VFCSSRPSVISLLPSPTNLRLPDPSPPPPPPPPSQPSPSTSTMSIPATKQRKIAIVGSRAVGKLFAELHRRRRLHCRRELHLLNCAFTCDGLQLTHPGKSSLTVQFVDGHFVESYYPTIENTFSKTIRVKGQDYVTEIVDTAGQVRLLVEPIDATNLRRMSTASCSPSTLSASMATWSSTPSARKRASTW